MKKSWDDLLQPIPPISDNEITLKLAAEKLGVDQSTAQRRLKELTQTGQIEFVGDRKLPNGKVARAWKLA